jgi:citrate lyase subunit beta/citryl-CoA lyase
LEGLMRLRSLLFVPGDRPERLIKAVASGADGVIVDLEDSVSLSNKVKAREEVESFISGVGSGPKLFVRVNPISSAEFSADIEALGRVKPFAIVLPRCEGIRDVELAAAHLERVGSGSTKILPIATETPIGIFQLGSYGQVARYLCGLTWGTEDLPSTIGATTAWEADGRLAAPYEVVRTFSLFGAHAAGVAAIDTAFHDYKDLDGLRAFAARGRRDGFQGMLAVHPSQIPIINDAYTPNTQDIAWAKKIIAAFSTNPSAGLVVLDGRELDRPHLVMARKIMANAA